MSLSSSKNVINCFVPLSLGVLLGLLVLTFSNSAAADHLGAAILAYPALEALHFEQACEAFVGST